MSTLRQVPDTEKDFETFVRSRMIRIETKLSDYIASDRDTQRRLARLEAKFDQFKREWDAELEPETDDVQ